MATKNPDRIVDRTELAKFLNVDPDYVSVLVREGMPKVHHGRYELVRCLSWYVKHLQESLKKRGLRVPGDVNERDAKLRILKAQADMRELELARERGELVAIPDIEKRWTDIVTTTRARLLAVADRVTPRIVGEGDRSKIQKQIDSEIREALIAIANSGRTGLPDEGRTPPASHPPS